MAIDVSLIRDIDQYFAALLQSQAQSLIYMRRFTREFNQYGRCSYCYDDTTGQITNSDCPVCFGTGFDKGYSDPVQGINSPIDRVYGFFTRSHLTTDWQKTGIIAIQEDQLLYLKVGFVPGISDLIVDEQGTRYLVGNHIEDWTWNNDQYGYVVTVYQQDPQNSWKYNVPIPPTQSGNSFYNLSNLDIEFSDAVQAQPTELHELEIQVLT